MGTTMKKLFLILIMLLTLNGCVSSTVKDAIDSADEHVRLKWSEEWRPALLEEIASAKDEAKDAALKEAIEKIESFEQLNNEKLRQINVDIKDFDIDNDGKVTGAESVALLKELKDKNLQWWEILMIVAGGYVPMTGAKELLRSKMAKKGTGDGTPPTS